VTASDNKTFRQSGRRLLLIVAAVLAALLIAGTIFTWNKFFREEPQVFADENEHFKYGSLGAEGDRGLPYWPWAVLPRLFPQFLPRVGGYDAFGVQWELGQLMPVGFSLKTVGFPRVTNNCALCHAARYRLSREDVPTLVVGGPAHTVNVQTMLNYLSHVAEEPTFDSELIIDEIEVTHGFSWLEQQNYRRILIPSTKRALLQQKRLLEWANHDWSSGTEWGPGRVDSANMAKHFMTTMPLDNTKGCVDFPSIWNLRPRRSFPAGWSGRFSSTRSAIINCALGIGAPKGKWLADFSDKTEKWLEDLSPPAWPFTRTHPINAPLADEGKKIYSRDCASCHEPRGERTNKVIPIMEIGTDPEDVSAWSKQAADALARRLKELGVNDASTTESYGYVAAPLDGIWLRAPYLHNGSVPNLRDLLNAPEKRTRLFYRGHDVLDPINVGFIVSGQEAKESGFLFDTTVRGNGNGGHMYGVDLQEAEKEALLEYLKTL
jgi:mono/diheme cytochrome c family protein